jgi:hypothetical protein
MCSGAHRAWHVIPQLKHVTDVTIREVFGWLNIVCALESGIPWCWGIDGSLAPEWGGTGIGPFGLLGVGPYDRCVYQAGVLVLNSTDNSFHTFLCVRSPRRIPDVMGAVQIVSMGLRDYDHPTLGMCVRTDAGQIVCWGPETGGVPEVVGPPTAESSSVEGGVP